MKKLLISILMILATLAVFAQGEHLTFKGVPIDGTKKAFTAALTGTGCTFAGERDGVLIFTGSFTTYDNCIICARAAHDNVYMVSVFLHPYNSWERIFSEYTFLKGILVSKYGDPASSTEEFQGYEQPMTDSDRFLRLQLGDCNFESQFSAESKGTILLKMASSSGTPIIFLSYYDAVNQQKALNASMNDL